MKKFFPCNRHISILPYTSSKEETSQEEILLPEEYSKSKSKEEEYSLWKVDYISNDLHLTENAFNCLEKDDLILVDSSMVKKVETPFGTYYFVLNNYVLAVLK